MGRLSWRPLSYQANLAISLVGTFETYRPSLKRSAREGRPGHRRAVETMRMTRSGRQVPTLIGHRRIENRNIKAAGNNAIKEYISPAVPARPNATTDTATRATSVHRNGWCDIECGNAKHIIEASATNGMDTWKRSLTSHKPSQNALASLRKLRVPNKTTRRASDTAHVTTSLATTSRRSRSKDCLDVRWPPTKSVVLNCALKSKDVFSLNPYPL